MRLRPHDVRVPLTHCSDAGVAAGTRLRVRAAALPRAAFIRLQPLTPGFSRLPEPRAALERTLSTAYTLLAPGQVIHVHHGLQTFAMLVREVRPAGARGLRQSPRGFAA